MTPVALAATGAALLAAHAVVNARLLRQPTASLTTTCVSVLLPLRNEASRVTPCLRALLGQQGVDLEIVVLDDASTDSTAELVQSLAGDDPRVRLLTGRTLPTGWLGKPHACQQLADAAAPTSDVLVFVDADVVLAPHAVAATVALLEQTGLDLLSPYPRQEAPGWTALVQPLLQWSWLTFLPLRIAESSSRPSLSAANGQLLAVRRTTYDRVGGHTAVRDAVVEDVELLRALKRVGGRGGICDGTALATTRMYDGWNELVAGYTKSLWTLPVPTLAVLAFFYLLPPLAAMRGSRVGSLGYAAGVAGRAVSARRTGSPALPAALAHPLSVTAICALAGRSWLARRRGTLTWKGRAL
ncbi:MAG: glycosyltransferase [Actinobacteria bacterium]|nr:glycosyltransferase [Actinomycetota bacterium]